METCVVSPRIAVHAQSIKPQCMNAISIFLRLAMFVALALPCAATSADPTCPELKRTIGAVSQLLADGNAAFETGDIAKAEACWTKVRECAAATPDWPKAVFNLGLLEYRRNNLRQAIAYFNQVLQAQPNDKEPGGNIMETNRNYSNRSALAISQCYEAMGAYGSALRYARLAQTKYPYYSWCGTCYNNANFALNKRIVYLTVRASRVHIWASMLVLGFFALRWKKVRKQ
jgi:tetratricopeptide (TPR) repeat protein